MFSLSNNLYARTVSSSLRSSNMMLLPLLVHRPQFEVQLPIVRLRVPPSSLTLGFYIALRGENTLSIILTRPPAIRNDRQDKGSQIEHGSIIPVLTEKQFFRLVSTPKASGLPTSSRQQQTLIALRIEGSPAQQATSYWGIYYPPV